MNLKKVVLMLSAILAVNITSAQIANDSVRTVSDTASPIQLTLESAKQYALEHNRTMQTADLNIKKAEKARWEAISNMLVNVSATLQYQNMLGYEMNFGGQSIEMPPSGTLGITASVTINGQIIVGVQLSKMAIEMQQLSQSNDELSVKANATTAYLTVLIAEESYKILEESRNNLEKTYRSIEQMAQVGMTEQTDADQLKVQLMTMDNSLRSAKRNIELAYNALRLVLGTDVDAKIIITENLDYYFETQDASIALDGTFDVNNNTNIKLLDKNIELSQKQVTLKRWAYAPTLTFAYQYSGKTYFGKKEGFNMQPPHTLVATLNIPIFSSGNRWAAVQQAKIDVDIAQTQREQTVDQLLVQDAQLRYNLSNALETYQTNKETVDLNQKIFKNYLQKYEQGMVSSTDLISINNTLLQAQGNYIQSLYDVISAQTALLQLYNTL
ncbi:MAG: TolC family protein [Bacteroidales bacterium]|nr:TolC family protein [Bacteroidales bacterium]